MAYKSQSHHPPCLLVLYHRATYLTQAQARIPFTKYEPINWWAIIGKSPLLVKKLKWEEPIFPQGRGEIFGADGHCIQEALLGPGL